MPPAGKFGFPCGEMLFTGLAQVSFRLQNPEKAQPAQWVHAEVTGAVRVGTVLMTAGAVSDLGQAPLALLSIKGHTIFVDVALNLCSCEGIRSLLMASRCFR